MRVAFALRVRALIRRVCVCARIGGGGGAMEVDGDDAMAPPAARVARHAAPPSAAAAAGAPAAAAAGAPAAAAEGGAAAGGVRDVVLEHNLPLAGEAELPCLVRLYDVPEWQVPRPCEVYEFVGVLADPAALTDPGARRSRARARQRPGGQRMRGTLTHAHTRAPGHA